MNSNQSLMLNDLVVDLAFSGFIPKTLKSQIDQETTTILTSLDAWTITLQNWINFVRIDPNLICPKIVRNNNTFSLGLLFADDLYISSLNNLWRKENVPTDVLSFSALEDEFNFPYHQCIELGDIIVSVETAYKQSRLHQHSLSEELKWLVSHGLLHLLGWDHPDQPMLDKMLALQDQLLQLNSNLPFHKGINK